jgi:DNA repair exonuclease SbcCD ATPase subunit
MKGVRVARLWAKGLKGTDFECTLGPITVFTGPNGAGKTARLEALQLALEGKTLSGLIPKTAQGVALLAGAPKMEIGVDLTDGKRIIRRWSIGSNGVRTSHDVPDGLTGPAPLLLEPMQFLEMSDQQQVEYLLKAAREHDDDASPLFDRIRAALGAVVMDDAVRELVDEVVKALDESDYQRHEEGRSVLEWLPDAGKIVSTSIRSLRERLQQERKVLEVTAPLARQSVKVSGTEEDLRALDVQIEQTRARLQSIQEERKTWEKKAAELQVAQRELARIPEAKARLEALIREAASIEAEFNRYQSKTPDLTTALIEQQHAKSEADALVASLQGQTSRLYTRMKEVEGMQCPCCGKVGEECRAYGAILARLRVEYDDAGRQLKKAEKMASEAANAVDQIRKSLDISREEDRKAQDMLQRLVQLRREIATLSVLCDKEPLLLRIVEDCKGLQEPPSPEALKHELDQLIERRAALGNELQIKRGIEDARKRAAEAETRAARLEVAVEALKAVGKVIDEYAETSMAASVRKFGEVIQKVSNQTALRGAITVRDGALCVERDGKVVSYRALSTAERVILLTGIAVALSNGDGLKVLLLDELSRLDRGSAHRLMWNMLELVERGLVDQVIATDWDAEVYKDIKGVEVQDV